MTTLAGHEAVGSGRTVGATVTAGGSGAAVKSGAIRHQPQGRLGVNTAGF